MGSSLKIHPTKKFRDVFNMLCDEGSVPPNIAKVLGRDCLNQQDLQIVKPNINDDDLKNIKNIGDILEVHSQVKNLVHSVSTKTLNAMVQKDKEFCAHFLTTSDIEWIYVYLEEKRKENTKVPYLHTLMEGAYIDVFKNKMPERNRNKKEIYNRLQATENHVVNTLKINIDTVNLNHIEHLQGTLYEKQRLLLSTLSGTSYKHVHRRSKGGRKEHQD